MGMTTDMGIRPGMHTFSMTAGLGDIGTGRARQMEAVEKAKGKNEGGGQENRIPPVRRDVYVHGDAPARTDIYCPAADGNGEPGIRFDDPGRQDAGRNVLAEGRTEEKRASASPEKSEKTEECTTNTDKVDREIRELRKKKKELEQKLARSDGPEEKKRLETQLQQTERELQMKDNDSYRRSHAQYS